VALFAFVWVEVNCTSLIRGLIVLRFFDKRSEFFSDREDSKLPLNMCRSIERAKDAFDFCTGAPHAGSVRSLGGVSQCGPRLNYRPCANLYVSCAQAAGMIGTSLNLLISD